MRSSSVSPDRRQREVVAVRGPGEVSRRSDEWSRNDAADAESLSHQLVGGLAGPIQLLDRHDLFVRGDLEHAVGRGIHNPCTGAQVLWTERVDDRRARGRHIADDRTTGPA